MPGQEGSFGCVNSSLQNEIDLLNWSRLVQICLNLSEIAQTCPNLFKLAQTCLNLPKLAQTCPNKV